jgi:hypothetical protein
MTLFIRTYGSVLGVCDAVLETAAIVGPGILRPLW